VRRADLHVLQGTPARNPERPELTRTGSIYEIGLADIFVTKGVATITNEKITDTRMETARCGIISAIDNWDTTTIYQQIQSELAHFKSNEEADFTTWFNYMKDQLSEDAAGRLQTEVDEINLLKADKTALAETNTNLENTNGNISIIEDTTTASRNYAVGEFVTVKTEGKLRKVTSAITSGGTISNSNTEITNAGAEISQINAELSDYFTWKSAGTLTTSSSSLNLPTNYKEVLVNFTITSGTTNVRATIYIPKLLLGGVERIFRTGYYAYGNASASFSIKATTTEISEPVIWQNGSQTTSWNIEVLYR
jgi:hypothetical protein